MVARSYCIDGFSMCISLGGLRAPLTHGEGREGTKSSGAEDPRSGHARSGECMCRGLSCTFATDSTRIVVEGSGGRAHSCVRAGVESSEQARQERATRCAISDDGRMAMAMAAACVWTWMWMQWRERVRSRDGGAEVHCSSRRGVQETRRAALSPPSSVVAVATLVRRLCTLGLCSPPLWREPARDSPRAANRDERAPVASSRSPSCRLPGVVLAARLSSVNVQR